jgi:hypothetical protein
MATLRLSFRNLMIATICSASCFGSCAVDANAADPRNLPVTPELRAKGVTQVKVTSDGVVQYLINDQWHDVIPKTTGRGPNVTVTGKDGNIGRTPSGTTAVEAPDAAGNKKVIFDDGRIGILRSNGTYETVDNDGRPIVKRPGQGWTSADGKPIGQTANQPSQPQQPKQPQTKANTPNTATKPTVVTPKIINAQPQVGEGPGLLGVPMTPSRNEPVRRKWQGLGGLTGESR